jgi:branched-chain amino acid transport system permease protein
MAGYLLHLAVMVGIYAILAYSMNLILGFGGLLPFCHAALYGVGAYAYALARIKGTPAAQEGLLFTADWPFLPALALAIAAASLAGLVFALCALRFRGDFFIFATLGIQMIWFVILHNWAALGRGAFGIYGIPRPELMEWKVDQAAEYAGVIVLCAAGVCGALLLLYRSPFGLSLKALREDERAAESLGIPSFWRYFATFGIAGACAGVAGALFASYVTYIDPTSFSLRESIFLVTLMLLGGSGNVKGPLAGVLMMVLLPEALRFLGLSSTLAPNVREILYGAILIALMFLRPQGLAGEYRLDS